MKIGRTRVSLPARADLIECLAPGPGDIRFPMRGFITVAMNELQSGFGSKEMEKYLSHIE